MSQWSKETVHQVWNDGRGDRFEVSPDRDSLGLIEIRALGSDGKVEAGITFPPEAADLICAAIQATKAEVQA